MAFDYAELAVEVSSIITEFGQSVTFTRTADGSYTPGTAPSQTDTTFTMQSVVDNYSAREVDGSTIQVGDMRVFCTGATPPIIGDTLAVNGLTWRIVNVTPVNPAGTVLLYELQVRR